MEAAARQIEGIPEGYEIVRFGIPKDGELFLSYVDGKVRPFVEAGTVSQSAKLIMQKVDPVTVKLKPGIYTMNEGGQVDWWPLEAEPYRSVTRWCDNEYFATEIKLELVRFSSDDWTKCKVVVTE